MSRLTPLKPEDYRRIPWKNGGGVSVDIAVGKDEVWRFGRTPITAGGPFSDYSGFDRLQVLVSGRGLVLQTPSGEIDVRRPFRPVRFAGETPIVSRLEAGPVEVVNLIGERSRVRLDLRILDQGTNHRLGAGIHIIYCPGGRAVLRIEGKDHALQADEGLRIEDFDGVVSCVSGVIVLGSVTCVSR
jgi:environmental stress-induced protein Ves